MPLRGILCEQSLQFWFTRRADCTSLVIPCMLVALILSDNLLGPLNGPTRKEVSCTLSPLAA
jgi:hypothetical protein